MSVQDVYGYLLVYENNIISFNSHIKKQFLVHKAPRFKRIGRGSFIVCRERFLQKDCFHDLNP